MRIIILNHSRRSCFKSFSTYIFVFVANSALRSSSSALSSPILGCYSSSNLCLLGCVFGRCVLPQFPRNNGGLFVWGWKMVPCCSWCSSMQRGCHSPGRLEQGFCSAQRVMRPNVFFLDFVSFVCLAFSISCSLHTFFPLRSIFAYTLLKSNVVCDCGRRDLHICCSHGSE